MTNNTIYKGKNPKLVAGIVSKEDAQVIARAIECFKAFSDNPNDIAHRKVLIISLEKTGGGRAGHLSSRSVLHHVCPAAGGSPFPRGIFALRFFPCRTIEADVSRTGIFPCGFLLAAIRQSSVQCEILKPSKRKIKLASLASL